VDGGAAEGGGGGSSSSNHDILKRLPSGLGIHKLVISSNHTMRELMRE
jgi:hypothetical protein